MLEDLIFDVGLHKGEDSEFYLKKGFRVVAVEANAELCTTARRRLEPYLARGRLTIVNAAIGEREGPVKFYVNRRFSVLGTAFPEWVDRNRSFGADSYETTVDGIRFERLLERFGCPYHLEIDIEGVDLLCIQALKVSGFSPKYVSIDSNKVAWPELLREFELLESLGYTRFKVVAQDQVKNQTPPSPAREGIFVEHEFEDGSSGLFGEEAPGRWLSKREALAVYRGIFRRYRLFGDAGTLRGVGKLLGKAPLLWRLSRTGWYDTHAAL